MLGRDVLTIPFIIVIAIIIIIPIIFIIPFILGSVIQKTNQNNNLSPTPPKLKNLCKNEKLWHLCEKSMYIIWKDFLLKKVATINFALDTVVEFHKSGIVFVIDCEIIAECFSSGFRLTKPRKCSEVWLEHLQCLVKPVRAMLDFISCLWHIQCYVA